MRQRTTRKKEDEDPIKQQQHPTKSTSTKNPLRWLFDPIPPYSLAIFRVIWGVIMIYETVILIRVIHSFFFFSLLNETRMIFGS